MIDDHDKCEWVNVPSGSALDNVHRAVKWL